MDTDTRTPASTNVTEELMVDMASNMPTAHFTVDFTNSSRYAPFDVAANSKEGQPNTAEDLLAPPYTLPTVEAYRTAPTAETPDMSHSEGTTSGETTPETQSDSLAHMPIDPLLTSINTPSIPPAIVTHANLDASHDDNNSFFVAAEDAKPARPDAQAPCVGDITSSQEHSNRTCRDVFSMDLSADPRPNAPIKREAASPLKAAGPLKKKRTNPNHVPPYDDEVEKAQSRLAVDQPCFGKAESLVTIAVELVHFKIEELKGRGYNDAELDHIHSKLSKFRYPECQIIKPIGFLGDQAAGKSSLINCLLTQHNIAAECDDGASGTSVIQELVAPEAEGDALKAVVYYHGPRQIEALVLKHFQSVYDYQHVDDTEDLGKDDQGMYRMGSDDLDQLARHSSTALDFFVSLLCDHEQFKTTSTASAYIASARSRVDEQVIATLIGYVNDFFATLPLEHGATTITGQTIGEINKSLRIYKGSLPTQDGRVPSPWPIVRRIRFHLPARILSEGLILADLPGTSDTNLTKVAATQQYLSTCELIVIAHPIARIQSQASLWKNIQECIRSGKLKDIILVVTKIDDLKHDRERDDISDSDKRMLQGLKARADDLQEDVTELHERRDTAEAEEDDGEYAIVDRDLRTAIKKQAEAVAEWKQTNIMLRNERNAVTVQKAFKQASGSDHTLPIYFVSNTIYQAHMKGSDRSNPPDLTIEGTGVPGLRTMLLSRPAKRRMNALRKVSNSKNGHLPRTLLAMEMICSKSRLERKNDVSKTIAAPSLHFNKLLLHVKSDLRREFAHTMQTMELNHEATWKARIRAEHAKWVKMRYSRYGAFCRHNGVWRAKNEFGTDDELSWNDVINEIAADDISKAFTKFKTLAATVQSNLANQTCSSLDDLVTTLDASPELMGVELSAFLHLIKMNCIQGEEVMSELFDSFEVSLNTIRYTSNSINSQGSYLVASMQEVYEECAPLKGTGVFNRMKNIVLTKLCGPENVFHDVITRAKADFEVELDDWADLASQRVGYEFENIIADFDRRFDNLEPDDQVKRDYRNELLFTVNEARRIVDTEIRAQLEQCAKFD